MSHTSRTSSKHFVFVLFFHFALFRGSSFLRELWAKTSFSVLSLLTPDVNTTGCYKFDVSGVCVYLSAAL